MAAIAGRIAASARQVAGFATRTGTRSVTVDAQAVRYAKHGHPTSVLRFETIKVDTAGMKPSDVFVRMVAAPITPSDLAQVGGFTGRAPSFPRVGGNEGVGVVEEAGSSSGLKKGDIVVASKGGVGTWSTHVIAPAEAFTKVSLDLSKTQIEPVAACVAPVLVASQLLASVPLKAGDVVVQNGAASTVGQAVIQLAAAKGVRTVNITQLVTDWSGLVNHLQGIGAGVVVSQAAAGKYDFRKVLADLPAPVLGLNGVGGAAASAVLGALGSNGTLVTYGSMSKRPVVAPLSAFTGKELTLKGFNLSSWINRTGKAERDAAVTNAVSSVADGKVKLLVARESFKDFQAALKRSYAKEQRKVVLTF